MLNQNLSHAELTSDLKEYIERIDFLLSEIDSKEIHIIDDKKLMGKLHHSMNISNYQKPEFREKLLRRANNMKLEQFFRKLQMIDSKLRTHDVEKLVKRAAHFPWGNNDETKIFVETFGYEKNLIPREQIVTAPHELCGSYGEPLKTLKDYQTDIFFRSLHKIQNPWSRFIVKMPTGAGKTRTTMEIICHFLMDENKQGFEQIVWIADRDELCEQAISSIKHVWPHIGYEDLHIYRLWGSRSHGKFENPSFIVATYQTLYNMLKKGKPLPKPHLIISDEAHNVLAPTHQRVLDNMSKYKTRIIGLTATPIRSNNPESKRLMKFFYNSIIEINTNDENAINYLQGRGYLAHCIPKSIPSNREYRLTKEQRKRIELNRDLDPGTLDRIAKDNKRNIIIAENLLKLQREGKQVLYFGPSVEHSKFMCMIMLSKDVKAAHVDGDTPTEYRRDVVRKFRDNEINFVFNFDVFTTGFDAPNIDVVFIARPTKSLIVHQQMIGRGMRGKKMGGTDTFQLYRIVDNMPDIDLADEYFTDIWKYSEDDTLI